MTPDETQIALVLYVLMYGTTIILSLLSAFKFRSFFSSDEPLEPDGLLWSILATTSWFSMGLGYLALSPTSNPLQVGGAYFCLGLGAVFLVCSIMESILSWQKLAGIKHAQEIAPIE